MEARLSDAPVLEGSLWFLPLLGGVAAAVLAPLELQLDERFTVPDYWQYAASTASAVLAAIVGATAALTGFVVTVSVLVLQMATSTFSARYMRTRSRRPTPTEPTSCSSSQRS